MQPFWIEVASPSAPSPSPSPATAPTPGIGRASNNATLVIGRALNHATLASGFLSRTMRALTAFLVVFSIVFGISSFAPKQAILGINNLALAVCAEALGETTTTPCLTGFRVDRAAGKNSLGLR